MKRIFFVFLLGVSQSIQAQWTVEVAPYLWASSLDGTEQVDRLKFKVSEPFSELVKKLDFGAMLWVAAYQDDFGLFFNGVYSKVSDNATLRRLNISASSVLTIDSFGLTYKLFPSADKKLSVEPYAGARYTLNDNKISIDFLSANQRHNWTDAILGARLNYNLTSAFNVEGSADYGRGADSSSYNLSAFLGYQSPRHFKNTRFYLGYRFLHQNYHRDEGIHYYVWNMDISGPIAGVLFKF